MNIRIRGRKLGKPPVAKKDITPDIEDGAGLVPFEKEIDRQIGDLIPQKSRDEAVRRITAVLVSEHFSGPIAHPRHLREYESIQQGAADRIIAMAEKRNEHHIDMDQRVVGAEVADRKLGMILGASLFGILIICALVSALSLKSATITGLFLGATVIGGVGLFIKGRNSSP